MFTGTRTEDLKSSEDTTSKTSSPQQENIPLEQSDVTLKLSNRLLEAKPKPQDYT